MKKRLLLIFALVALAGCGGRLTGYNLKATIANTNYEDGNRAVTTAGSIDAHFDVPARH